MGHADNLHEQAQALIQQAQRAYTGAVVRYDYAGHAVRAHSAASLLRLMQCQLAAQGERTPIALAEHMRAALAVVARLEGRAQATSIDLAHLMAVAQQQGGGELGWDLLETHVRAGSRRQPLPVVLHGFGRVGRLLCRLAAYNGLAPGVELRAILVRAGDLALRQQLLARDSVHGALAMPTHLETEGDTPMLCVGELRVPMIVANTPADVPYDALGLRGALLLDNTGARKEHSALAAHLTAGAGRVVLTAPASAHVPTYVYGINHEQYAPARDTVLSAASCTTTAAAIAMKPIQERFGIESGHLETVHAYTNDQNLVDNLHKTPRRGRAAAENIILSTTGAAKALARVLPELAGKLTGNAVRVPVANVSLGVLVLRLAEAPTLEQINDLYRQSDMAQRGMLSVDDSGVMASRDAVGTTAACVIDLVATLVQGRQLVLYFWYDNEMGYARHVWRLVEHLSK